MLEAGEPLAAIRSRGLRLIELSGDETRVENLLALSDPMELGAQDVVLLAVKAYAIPGLAKALRPLFGAETVVVTLQNGVPCWYFQRLAGPRADWRVDVLDPHGEIASNIEAERILGAVVELAGKCGVSVPCTEVMYASLALLDQTLQSGRSVRLEPSD